MTRRGSSTWQCHLPTTKCGLRWLELDWGMDCGNMEEGDSLDLMDIQSISQLTNRIFKHSHFQPTNHSTVWLPTNQPTNQPSTRISQPSISQTSHTFNKAPEHNMKQPITFAPTPPHPSPFPPLPLQPVTLRFHCIQLVWISTLLRIFWDLLWFCVFRLCGTALVHGGRTDLHQFILSELYMLSC